ncbi:hypothetical protein MKX01_006950, partial [Papaver californicum]
ADSFDINCESQSALLRNNDDGVWIEDFTKEQNKKTKKNSNPREEDNPMDNDSSTDDDSSMVGDSDLD